MLPSSRTPEGDRGRCPVCQAIVRMEPSSPTRDAPCPCCGSLIWFRKRPRRQDALTKKVAAIRPLIRIDESSIGRRRRLEAFKRSLQLHICEYRVAIAMSVGAGSLATASIASRAMGDSIAGGVLKLAGMIILLIASTYVFCAERSVRKRHAGSKG